MTRRWVFSVAVWLLGLTLGTGLGIAISQQAAPTETKGVTITPPPRHRSRPGDRGDARPPVPDAVGDLRARRSLRPA